MEQDQLKVHISFASVTSESSWTMHIMKTVCMNFSFLAPTSTYLLITLLNQLFEILCNCHTSPDTIKISSSCQTFILANFWKLSGRVNHS